MIQFIRSQFGPALLFASIHLAFILHLHHESYKDVPNHLLLIPLLLLPFYFILPFHSAKLNTSVLIKNTFAFTAGFMGTIFLQNYFSAVISSALLATIFVLISEVVSEVKTFKLTNYQAAMYAGTFGGMLSSDWVANNTEIIISCVIGGTLFSLLNNSLNGFGGKMGTIGFGSLIIWVIVQW